MDQSLISVVIPIYKTEETYLRNSIKSLLNQSYRKLEIILIDDGSPDQCGSICDSYAAVDNRIRVIHKKNGGVSSARNCGLQSVTGDYIFFMDSDDTLNRNAIEILILIAQSTDADITVCSCKHRYGHENYCVDNKNTIKKLKTVDKATSLRNLLYNIPVFEELEPTAVWGKLYKRNVVKQLKFNNNMNIAEDFVFNYFAICNSEVVTYCNLKLYNYNFVETSLMNSKGCSPNLIMSFEELVKFEKSQSSIECSSDLIVRCVSIAFSIYLRIPEREIHNLKNIQTYIQNNRGNVLINKNASLKIKAACSISYISFKLVRWLFNIMNK